MDWCGHCGGPLKKLHHGAYAQCCIGLAYWSLIEGYPGDPAFKRLADGRKVFYYFRPPAGQRMI